METKRDTFSGKLGFVFAALTSSISLLETNVSIVCDKLHWSRKKSTILSCVCSFGSYGLD